MEEPGLTRLRGWWGRHTQASTKTTVQKGSTEGTLLTFSKHFAAAFWIVNSLCNDDLCRKLLARFKMIIMSQLSELDNDLFLCSIWESETIKLQKKKVHQSLDNKFLALNRLYRVQIIRALWAVFYHLQTWFKMSSCKTKKTESDHLPVHFDIYNNI